MADDRRADEEGDSTAPVGGDDTVMGPGTFDSAEALLSVEEEGFAKSLTHRHVQMIAVGGAIGTGLFLGAGGRLNSAGPSLAIVYAVCGVVVFLVMRALAEMVITRPSSGSFVSYAREYIGVGGAYVAGWMYVLLWAFTGIAEITAIALYAKFWDFFDPIPQWLIALVALLCVLAVNLVSARLFGEIEFWAAIVKVLALVAFLVVGMLFLVTDTSVNGVSPGVDMITDNGGMIPNGLLAAVIVVPGVIFAYSGIELVSVAAGETKDPQSVVPRATNSVVWRVGIFYCGSVILLAMLLPYTAYRADESPFVTFFDAIGVLWADNLMNFVVITAALSSLNSGLYAAARILHSMSVTGAAPVVAGRMNSRHVPAGGILFLSVAYAFGIVLNLVVPEAAFEIVLNLAALGILSTWAFILVSHLRFLERTRQGVRRAAGFPDAMGARVELRDARLPAVRVRDDVVPGAHRPHHRDRHRPRRDRTVARVASGAGQGAAVPAP